MLTLTQVICIMIVTAIMAYIPVIILVSKQKTDKHTESKYDYFGLSYDEINEIIEGIISEIFTNKYLLYYKLKEITVIPNMDQEITTITKEVINAFSDPLIHEIGRFYSKDFLVMMITRKVQLLLVDYTNNNKPNTK